MLNLGGSQKPICFWPKRVQFNRNKGHGSTRKEKKGTPLRFRAKKGHTEVSYGVQNKKIGECPFLSPRLEPLRRWTTILSQRLERLSRHSGAILFDIFHQGDPPLGWTSSIASPKREQCYIVFRSGMIEDNTCGALGPVAAASDAHTKFAVLKKASSLWSDPRTWCRTI